MRVQVSVQYTRIYRRVVCFVILKFSHHCRFDRHEKEVGEMARQMGFTHVSLSSVVMPMVRIVPRGYTGE